MAKKARQKHREAARARRARQETKRRRTRPSGNSARSWCAGPVPGPNLLADMFGCFSEALAAAAGGDEEALDRWARRLAAFREDPSGDLFPESILVEDIDDAIGAAWSLGWRPRDLLRAVEKNTDGACMSLLGCAVLHGSHTYRPGTDGDTRAAFDDPAWNEQLDSIEPVCRGWDRRHPLAYLCPWAEAEGVDRTGRIVVAIKALTFLRGMPEIPVIGPYPGSDVHMAGTRVASGPAGMAAVLDRVRALLRKAESTDFPEEADALTAKAQEIMAREAIDLAMLQAGQNDTDSPRTRRVVIDDPYVSEKSMLLHEVAAANRCKAICHTRFGFSSVVGHGNDLDIVELLFSSLLVQATRSMHGHGSHRDAAGRSRTRSFRRSFLVSFAGRIGERLSAAVDAAVRDAESLYGGDLLPILVSRGGGVACEYDRLFGAILVEKEMTVSNAYGAYAGQVAADLADFTLFDEVHAAR